MVARAPVSWFELDTSSHQSPSMPGSSMADIQIDGVQVSNQELISPEGELIHPIHHPRMLRLLAEYAAICRLAEVTFPIVSAYRSPRWQKAYYMPTRTSHCLGYALDLGPVDDWTIGQMSAMAKLRWREEGSMLRGIGIYPNWLHIDIRPRERRRVWYGSSARLD